MPISILKKRPAMLPAPQAVPPTKIAIDLEATQAALETLARYVQEAGLTIYIDNVHTEVTDLLNGDTYSVGTGIDANRVAVSYVLTSLHRERNPEARAQG